MLVKLGIIPAVFVMVVLSGCGPCRRTPPPAPEALPDVQVFVDVTGRLERDATSGSIIYANQAADFTLLIPSALSPERYRVEEGLSPGVETLYPHVAHATRFMYVTLDEALDNEPLLTVLGFRKDIWPRARQALGTPSTSVLRETDDHIVVAMAPAENPYPEDSADHESFQRAANMLPLMMQSGRGGDGTSDPEDQPASGIYAATLPAADASGRNITLVLRPDGIAEMTTEYIDKGDPIVERGRWTRAANIVAVTLPPASAGDAPVSLVWTMDGDNLIPRTWDKSLYGDEGLPLSRSGN